MNEEILNFRTIAVTGHRIIEKNFDKKSLEKLFLALTEKNFDTFLIGMALGFDTLCFQILENIRKEKDIKIIACVPCKSQSYKFSLSQKVEYDRMISVADKVIMVSVDYDEKCMQRRNEFMVNNSSGLVAYLRRDKSGTASTVRYAEKKGIPIIRV